MSSSDSTVMSWKVHLPQTSDWVSADSSTDTRWRTNLVPTDEITVTSWQLCFPTDVRTEHAMIDSHVLETLGFHRRQNRQYQNSYASANPSKPTRRLPSETIKPCTEPAKPASTGLAIHQGRSASSSPRYEGQLEFTRTHAEHRFGLFPSRTVPDQIQYADLLLVPTLYPFDPVSLSLGIPVAIRSCSDQTESQCTRQTREQ
ncbi:hypothetical protein F2Q68_00039986 [Brassica cretica]|uniref:Uncharacterized protein n=1 Tax=Brassica cretica TaxID=69181 RepID=A0A8S9MHX0_BRACR|nr:hypothetical protein F2Q68_00039986 [Brassica cretica]